MTLRRADALRGRDPELGAIDAALAEVRRGGGRVVIVQGPPGIGKTALLAEACGRAERSGVRVFAGEAFESGRTIPFAPLLAALSAGRPPVVDAALVRELEATADGRYWVVHDLQSALETAAARAPLVVALDDLQWADNATLAALHALVPGLAELPVLWLLALRTGYRRRTVTEVLTRLERDGAVRVRLAGLAPDAVRAVLRGLVGAEPGATLVALAEQTHGNPFLLLELVRGLREDGRLHVEDGRAEVVGDHPSRRFTSVVAERIATLSAAAQQTVRVAAALPPRFPAAQLAAVLRLPPAALVSPLEEAVHAELLAADGEQLGFRHQLLREAVLSTMPPSLRRALQRDAVAVLIRAGAAPGEVALQLAASAEPGDREAAAVLREAARSIAGSDAVAAADLSARALDLLPPADADRGMLTAETVTLMHRAQRSGEAAALAERALAAVLPPAEEAAVRLTLSGLLTRPTPARAEENRRALALPGLPPLLRGRHLAWLAYNLAVGGDVEPVTAAAETALRHADATADVETRVVAGLGLALVDGFGGAYGRALARLEDLCRLSRGHDRALFAAVLAVHRSNTLAVLGRIDDARAMVVDGIVSARQERDALLLDAWTRFGGLLRLAAGELSDARAEAAWSGPAGEEADPDTFAGVARMVASCHVGAHAGDPASLRAGRAAARRVGPGSSPAVRRLAARLLARTASGPGAAAEAARLFAADPLVPAVPLVPCDYGYQPRVARLARQVGDAGTAERAAASTEAVQRENPGVHLFAGIAAQTRGLAADDPALLVDAARLLHGTRRPLVAATASEDAGRALGLRGDAAAVGHLRSAFDVYVALGANADARRVAGLLRRHGVVRRVDAERPGTGWESLTPSELQVVRIIAEGATNRRAAELLYVSPHTVSSHLRSAFAKLGITSRVQLAALVREREP